MLENKNKNQKKTINGLEKSNKDLKKKIQKLEQSLKAKGAQAAKAAKSAKGAKSAKEAKATRPQTIPVKPQVIQPLAMKQPVNAMRAAEMAPPKVFKKIVGNGLQKSKAIKSNTICILQ